MINLNGPTKWALKIKVDPKTHTTKSQLLQSVNSAKNEHIKLFLKIE
jgi:hypothetical protein